MIQGIALAQLETRRFSYMRQQLACDRARHLVKTLAALVLVMSFGVPAVSQEASAPDGSSAEMKQIFDADQADREVNMAAMTPAQRMDWFSKIGPRDAERRKQVMDLISRGVLHTGEDFDEAAFVFHAW